MLVARTVGELRERRLTLGISQRSLAAALDCSQPYLWRIEAGRAEPDVVRLSEIASVLGLELSIGVHDIGDPIHDRGQQALAKRFEAILSPKWRSLSEVLLPNPGDLRSWDKLLRLNDPGGGQVVGADLETRIRDIQALVRRTRRRERDGGVDEILLVLSDSATNRRLVGELRDTLGPAYKTSPRLLLKGLRAGSALVGSGVVLV
jgi:transcriptional regulator with XRE-family HTH domain